MKTPDKVFPKAEPSHRTLIAFSSTNTVPSERWLLLAKMGKLITSIGLRMDVDHLLNIKIMPVQDDRLLDPQDRSLK